MSRVSVTARSRRSVKSESCLTANEAGRLTLVGVHLPLVAEEFGVETEVGEVLVPAVVDLIQVTSRYG